MTNTKFKFKLSVVSGTISSEQLNIRPPSGKNAYRIDAIKLQVDDFDAEASNDMVKIQLAYQDLAGGTFLTIDDDDEILTLSERQATMTAQNEQALTLWHDKLRDQGILYLDGRDFKDVFIVKSQFWLNADSAGQDASEEFHLFISGHYVKLQPKVIDQLKQGVTLS